MIDRDQPSISRKIKGFARYALPLLGSSLLMAAGNCIALTATHNTEPMLIEKPERSLGLQLDRYCIGSGYGSWNISRIDNQPVSQGIPEGITILSPSIEEGASHVPEFDAHSDVDMGIDYILDGRMLSDKERRVSVYSGRLPLGISEIELLVLRKRLLYEGLITECP